ncbi:KPN_02809 family neutral zinc metallopeptidase [Hyphococcus aureus]|uniref:KPN_02809 family neutral zinc metallopeptidase n=1 Tax=Hyphococcus aureus TaxID=2666033 RepID=UPI003D9C2EF4
MKWQGRRQSRNVEDRRGAAAAGGAGILLMLLRLIIGRFGIRGLLFVGVIGVGLYMAGVNPMALLQGGGVGQQQAEPIDDESSQFVRAVLAETEDVWSRLFEEAGSDYPEPTLVMFTGNTQSGCGFASSGTGPFYCPADQKLYLDVGFFRELAQRFGAPGDFAAAYVIAHEVGHHVQTVTGISNQVRTAQQRARGEAEANAYQVMMELQADCYAGVWAHYADRMGQFLDAGDIAEGLKAAEVIGDDALQRGAGQEVKPEKFTHGSSAQRQRWFTQGYRSGSVDACDTFNTQDL